MKQLLFSFLLIGLILPATAQEISVPDISPNGIYLEGYLLRHDFNDGFVSLNYERRFGERKGILARVGFYPDVETLYTFPVLPSPSLSAGYAF